MKISSASKKVLASALSAAMVVAFAPTVAFGAAGDAITVTVDLAGGTGAQTDYSWAKQGNTISLGSPTKDDYSLDHWYLDANGDGAQNEDEEDISDPASVKLPVNSATATYRAVYAVPGFDSSGIAYNASAAKLTVTVENASKAVKGHDYTVTVKNPAGTVVGKKVFKAATEGDKAATITDGAIEVVFEANPASDANTEDNQLVANLRDLVSGEYTAEVSDGTAVVSTAKTKLLQLTKVDNTRKPAVTTTELIQANATGTATATGLSGNWLDADGYAAGADYSFTADSTITKTNGKQYATGGTYSSRVVEFTVSDSYSTEGDAYAVTVTSPSGKSVYSAALTAVSTTFSKTLKFTFDQADTDVQKADGGATEEAGTYVIAVTKTGKLTGETSSSKAKAVLTEVAYDVGEGSFAKAATAAEKDYFVDGSTTTVDLNADSVVEAPEGKVFSKWSLNGKEYNASVNVTVKAGQVNTVSAVYKAEAAKVAKPTLTSATKDLKKNSKTDYEYNVVLASATPGAAIYYTAGTSPADPAGTDTAFSSKITVSADNAAKAGYKIKAKAFYVGGSVDPALNGHDSDVVTIASLVDDQAAWKSFKQGAASQLENLVGKSTDTKWLSVDAVKAAVDAGQAAIDAEGYFTADEKSATKVYVAQYKAVYEAVLATAKAELAKYADEAPVASGTKAYYMTGDNYKQLAKAIDDIAKIVSVAEANDGDVEYADAVGYLITAVDAEELYTESKDYTAADVKAASDVTAALQAATDAASAKAAIEAYNALTDAQKKLVATADVTAAQKIVADQEKIDDQDQAAVNYCNSLKKKTVKVAKKTKKTAKKASVKWKKQVSESGNAVTYAKVSGSAKITVSSNGVATLKKGVKKGTYKVKIAASCGNATRNLVTAKFIVK